MKEEKNKKNKKKIILTGVIAITLLAVVIGATFAFFIAQTGTGKSASINVTTATTDSLKFEGGKTLTIHATQQNFGQGEGNESDDTTVSAILLANNNTNQASAKYYVYLDIAENNFVYTTEDKKAELLLQVTGPAGEVKIIPGLNYVTTGGESGFDITEIQGLITIADKYLIESTGTKEQLWTIKIVLVNLDSDQQENTDKEFTADVKIQKEKYKVIAYHEICDDNTLACHVAKQYGIDNSIYYHEKYDSFDTVFEELKMCIAKNENDECSNYNVIYYYLDDKYSEDIKRAMDLESKAQLGEIKEEDITEEMNNFMVSFYEKVNNGEILIFDTKEDAIQNATEIGKIEKDLLVNAEDYSYRYNGASPNNYVCFGSNDEICSEDNKYRIIGVFGDQVKLIKATAATSVQLGTTGASLYYWDRINGYNNTWSHSLLNTVNLNGTTGTTYINSFNTTWQNKISTTQWQVGGMTVSNGMYSNAKVAYDYEVGANKVNTIYEAKIGLMYVSDYGYAATPENWTINLNTYSNDTAKNNNWMYLGQDEWTISRIIGNTSNAFRVYSTGDVNEYIVSSNNVVRPVFFLESAVTYVSGTGTIDDPIRIS